MQTYRGAGFVKCEKICKCATDIYANKPIHLTSFVL